MKLIFLLVALIPILMELASATPTTVLVDDYGYGRVFRDARMSNDADDESDDEDDDEDDDEQDDDIYPPDFSKLFPNPDGRPTGPDSYDSYMKHHPANSQPGKPQHGPASSSGPASLRGPVQAQHGQKQGGVGHYAPSHDAPPPRRGSPPPRGYQSGPPSRGPPPSGPQYRSEEVENEVEDVVPEGRGLVYGQRAPVYHTPRRVLGYPNNRRVFQQTPYYGGVQNRYVVQPNRFVSHYPRTAYTFPHATRRQYYPRYTPVRAHGRADFDNSLETEAPLPGPVFVPRTHAARIYNPWSISPLRADAYNPQFVFNPSEMRARRRFRYHPSQIVPSQRIPVNDGVWGNPRDTYTHSYTGQQYGGNYFSSRF